MCVLCMFYVDWESGGWKKLKGRDFFFDKNLLGYGYRKQTTFLGLIPTVIVHRLAGYSSGIVH